MRSLVAATVKWELDPQLHAAAHDRPDTLCGLAESSLVRREESFRPDIADSCDLCAAEARSVDDDSGDANSPGERLRQQAAQGDQLAEWALTVSDEMKPPIDEKLEDPPSL